MLKIILFKDVIIQFFIYLNYIFCRDNVPENAIYLINKVYNISDIYVVKFVLIMQKLSY